MRFGCSPRQAQDGTAGLHVPIRRSHPHKRGYHIYAFGILRLLGKILGILSRLDELKSVTQPLYGGTGDENATL